MTLLNTDKSSSKPSHSLKASKAAIGILGSGWLGMPLAQSLIALGNKVHLSSRNSEKNSLIQSIGAKAFEVDIEQPHNGCEFLDVDTLIINITSKNIEGYKSLIKSIENMGVSNVLFISSTSVYNDADQIIGEHDTQYLKPCPLLTIEKCFQASTQFTTTILRFSGLMGYSRHPGRFFRSGKTIANANAPVNMIHRDDCIGLIESIIAQQKWGEVYNACANSHPTRKDFYTAMTILANEKLPTFEDATPPKIKIISNDKITKSLVYQWRWPNVMAREKMFD
jgi:nucleoside-diphosphate-sugar epimerase